MRRCRAALDGRPEELFWTRDAPDRKTRTLCSFLNPTKQRREAIPPDTPAVPDLHEQNQATVLCAHWPVLAS